MVKATKVKTSKAKGKGLIVKKLDFSLEDSPFLFKPQKPLSRSQISETITIGDSKQKEDKGKGEMAQEVIVISPSETEVIKDKKIDKSKRKFQRKPETNSSKRQSKDKEETVKKTKGKDKVIEKTEKEILEEQLKAFKY